MDTNTYDLETSDDMRSYDVMVRDAANVDDALRSLESGLREVRRDALNMIEGQPEGTEAFQARVDEILPKLDQRERDAWLKLDAIKRHIIGDRNQLQRIPYRPESYLADKAEAKSTAIMARIDRMNPAQIALDLQAVIRHGDPTEMAAWALSAPVLEAKFPASAKVTGPDGQQTSPAALFGQALAYCQKRTSDQEASDTLEQIESALQKVEKQISDLTLRRAAHDPTGGIGSELLTRQYGHKAKAAAGMEVAEQRRYDRDAILERLAAVVK